jgi:hypothetical protein
MSHIVLLNDDAINGFLHREVSLYFTVVCWLAYDLYAKAAFQETHI